MKRRFVSGALAVIIMAMVSMVLFGATMGDMEKLYTDPPNAKRFNIGYVLDKTSIRKLGDETYEIKVSAITKEKVAILRLIVDCKKKNIAYGCCETYDKDVEHLLAKSKECDTGFGSFVTPKGDMKEVARIFCQRHGKKDEDGN
jgi:hypothetical protein